MNIRMLKLTEAANILGLSPWTLRKYIRDRMLQSVKIGGRILIESTEIDRLIKESRQEPQR